MEVLAAQRDGRAQNQEIRPGDGGEGLVVHAADPRNAAPVIEADDEIDVERDTAALPDNQPNKIRRLVARRHKISERCRAVRRLELRLEDQRAVDSVGSTAFADPWQQCSSVRSPACRARQRNTPVNRTAVSKANRSTPESR